MNTNKKTARNLVDVRIILFLGLAFFLWPFSAYETFGGIAYLVFTALVVWYTWKWAKQEA